MLTGFITAYLDDDNKLVKDLKKIAMRYLKSDFIIDLIPLMPFTHYLKFEDSRFLFFIKCIRILKAFKMMDVRVLHNNVKIIYKNEHAKVCQDETKAKDRDVDHNHIIDQIKIKMAMLTVRLVVVTVIGGWFFGIFFFVYCDICARFDNTTSGTEYFTEKFEIETKGAPEVALIMMYWAFTTVMTVGFGDFYPAANLERVLGSFLMLSGVAMFTIIKDVFSWIYDFLVHLDDDLQDEENLVSFLNVLKRFNGN